MWKTLVQNGEVYSRYTVNEWGVVWDNKRDVEISQFLTGKPRYMYVNLERDNGMRVLRRVHNIVCWTFIGSPPEPQGYTVDHIDRDKMNNHVSNLRWANSREQILNRDVTILVEGVGIEAFLSSKGYKKGTDVYKYFLNKIRQTSGDYGEAMVGWANLLSPTYKIKECSLSNSIEYKGVWYPSKREFVKEYGNSSYDVFLDRLKKGMSVEEALTYVPVKPKSLYDKCVDANVSYSRISTLMTRRGLTEEQALNYPVERVNSHAINGMIKRNKEWSVHFEIDPIAFNSFLNKTKRSGVKCDRSFRDALEHFGIDTSEMEIHPCDGNVIMKHIVL